MDIRDRIQKLIDNHDDWSPRSVSLRAGLSDSFLSKFLNPDKSGGIKSMTLETLDKIAEAMEVTPRWLAYGEGPMTPDPKVVHIWDRIPERRKQQALRVLETFTDDKVDSSGAA